MPRSIGLDGLMVLPAMVYKSDERETAHALPHRGARRPALPIMVYNNPVSYGVDISPEAFARLADEPTLVAIKESSEDVRRLTDLRNIVGNRYILFGGVDDLVLESILLGAEGWISGLVNAFPDENRALWDLATVGPMGGGARAVPLVHAAAAPRYQSEAGAVHQAGHAGDGARVGDGARAAADRWKAPSAKRFWASSGAPSPRGPRCPPIAAQQA